MGEIELRLRRIARRVRFVRAWRILAVGGGVGAAASIVLAGLDFTGAYFTSWVGLIVPIIVGMVAGWLLGLFLPVPSSALAASLDRRAGLKDRLRTALERAGEQGPFDDSLRLDAATHLANVKPASAFPYRFTRSHVGLLLLSVLAAGIFLLGNSPIGLSDREKRDREELKAAAERIERIAKSVLEEVRFGEPTKEERDFAERLQRFALELGKGRLNKEEALRKVNELAAEADRLSRETFRQAEQTLMKAETALQKWEKKQLEEAGFGEIDPSLLQKTDAQMDAELEALRQRMEEISSMLGDGSLSDAERAALEANLQAASESAQRIELSKKARDFLNRLYQQPEYRELMEMTAEMQQLCESGQQGAPSLTREQVDEMIRRLEELADELSDDEALQEFVRELLDSMREGSYG